MNGVLSADASLMRRVFHGDFTLFKYSQRPHIQREPMVVQGIASVNYGVDARRYKGLRDG